jgi:hypothetical protein
LSDFDLVFKKEIFILPHPELPEKAVLTSPKERWIGCLEAESRPNGTGGLQGII